VLWQGVESLTETTNYPSPRSQFTISAFIIGKFRVPGALTMAQFDQAIADARKAAAKR